MAAAVIGALRVNLGLDSANFERGAKRVQSPLASMRKQFLAVAGVAAAMGAALSAAAIKGAQDIDRAAKAARRLDSSITGFRALELAADEAGVSLSGMTNDIQTMNRELASIGTSGNGARALEALGLSIDDLEGKDADEKLAIIADQVQALGLSAGETTAILRDLGVRNREMALLVLGGGDAIRAARGDIESYGLALSDVDASNIEKANDRIGRLGLITQYAGQQLALALVPAMGRLAEVMTESLRAGGLLRAVIDGLADNIERLGTYLAVAVAGFGVRYVGALVLAKIATASLSGALMFLRGALIRTGIGALVVGAGELVFQFTKLVTAAGGFGNAMGLLKDVAVEVWERIGIGVEFVAQSIKAMSYNAQAWFIGAIRKMAGAFVELTWTVADGLNSLFKTNLQGASAIITQELALAEKSAEAVGIAATAAAKAAADGFVSPLASIQALRDAMKEAKDETDGGAAAGDRLAEALEGVEEGAGGGGGGGAAGAVKEIKPALDDVSSGFDTFKSSVASAFEGLITGASSFKDALGSVLNSLANVFAQAASSALFGPNLLGGIIPGFANGTNNAPGGMALVGERGPELVNLPRGSQVRTASDTSRMMGGVGGNATLTIVAPEGFSAQQEGQIQGIAVRVTSQGLSAYDRMTLPSSVNRVIKDPRRLG